MNNQFTLHHGDCLDSMRSMADNSVDSVVCDPPYLIGFMGREWDHKDGIAGKLEVWRECLRVLKPGGHLLSFAGARTYHRIACAIEDAGFEIRDQIMYIFGSGFPKSLDVSKAIDKAAGAERSVVGFDSNSANRKSKNDTAAYGDDAPEPERLITTPATDAARKWAGFGTALKPAHEPICVARKPLAKGNTVAANVLQWGTGAINVDGCRVEAGADYSDLQVTQGGKTRFTQDGANQERASQFAPADGRWPANLILSDDDCVVAGFPVLKGAGRARSPDEGTHAGADNSVYSQGLGGPAPRFCDTGSSARFFYSAKVSKSERNAGLPEGMANTHPTLKPLSLMAYLARLVTPPGGTVLDPFMGSGSTGVACLREGFHFIGCELDPEYIEIARARIQHEVNKIDAARVLAAAAATPAPQFDLFAS